MFQRMFTASGIERVAVGKERQSAILFDDISNSLGIVRSEVCKVSEFSEMHLNGNELALKIYRADPGEPDELLKLCGKRDS